MRRIIVTLGAAVIVAGVAWAGDSWQEHMRTAEYAWAYQDYERAEQEFLEALRIAEGFEAGDRRLDAVLESLGRVYEHSGRYQEAEPLFARALQARSARAGADSPALLDLLAALARVHGHLGDQGAAQAELERYVAIAETARDVDVDQHLQALDQLGRLYMSQSRTEEVLPLQRRAAALRESDPRSTEEEIADALEGQARLEAMHGSEQTAEELFLRVVELRFGGGQPLAAAVVLASAASDCAGLGATEAAEHLSRTALEWGEEAGATDMDLIDAYRALADVAWTRVRRSTDSLTTLLEVAQPSQELEQAESALRTVYSLTPSLELARRLAQVHAMQGDVEGTLRWQREVLDTRRETQGVTGAQLVGDLDEIVQLQLRSGSTADAAETNAELITTLETDYGAESARLIQPLERQVELLTELGRKKEAKALRKRLRKLEKKARKG